jgi:hypothetical protein
MGRTWANDSNSKSVGGREGLEGGWEKEPKIAV